MFAFTFDSASFWCSFQGLWHNTTRRHKDGCTTIKGVSELYSQQRNDLVVNVKPQCDACERSCFLVQAHWVWCPVRAGRVLSQPEKLAVSHSCWYERHSGKLRANRGRRAGWRNVCQNNSLEQRLWIYYSDRTSFLKWVSFYVCWFLSKDQNKKSPEKFKQTFLHLWHKLNSVAEN